MTRLATIPALAAIALCLTLVGATAEGVSAQAPGHVLPSAFGAAGPARELPHYEEATELVWVGRDGAGRPRDPRQHGAPRGFREHRRLPLAPLLCAGPRLLAELSAWQRLRHQVRALALGV